ncbi:Imm49 family immunity protein [Streptomyces gamaensis]|uniref:Imm49 family immunity protein n=1 Tax=Streptomyces gamaensis TaxID=1763542 RepID=A0ABW0Z219_9ACTN
MRIERHQVDEAVVSAAREDFVNRIGSRTHSMAKAGPITTYEWWLIAEEFLDYLGALSVGTPDLDTPEAKAALNDAAEAAAGAVAYAAYYPWDRFHVFLSYVNFGMYYEPESEGQSETVSAREWLDAFCLAILADKAAWHGEAFHFARKEVQKDAAGRPAAELINGLMAYVVGDTGDDDADYPPSKTEVLTAIDAALARVRALDSETGQDLLDAPDSVVLRALRALAAGERDAFCRELTGLLLAYSTEHGPGAKPRTLLPLLPVALAALAYRREGWRLPVDTAYLPRAVVTGFEAAGPRVQAYGRSRRPDAVAELAAGPVVVERPDNPQPIHPESEALFEEFIREACTPVAGEPLPTWRLARAMEDQGMLFKWRASLSADVTDLEVENLRLASQLGAAFFRTVVAEPGTDVEVEINGSTLVYRAAAADRHDVAPGTWNAALNFALITGRREDIAALVLTGSALLEKDQSAYAWYRRALHDYLRGAEPEPATDRALNESEKAKSRVFVPAPAVLLSQLVEGDEESFNLALIDALEAHRDHHQVADRATEPAAAINLDILALACHARRRGWNIRVASPYLPPRLLRAAGPL